MTTTITHNGMTLYSPMPEDDFYKRVGAGIRDRDTVAALNPPALTNLSEVIYQAKPDRHMKNNPYPPRQRGKSKRNKW